MPSPLPHTGMWKSAADSFAFKQVVESIKGTDACVYLKFLQLSGFKHHCETSITFYNTSLDRGLGLLIHFWFKSFDICLWKAWQVDLNHLLAYRRLLSWKDGSLVKWFLNPHNTLRGSKLQKQIVAFYTHTAWWLEAHIAGRLLQSDCLMPSSPKLPKLRGKRKKKNLKITQTQFTRKSDYSSQNACFFFTCEIQHFNCTYCHPGSIALIVGLSRKI